METIKINKWKNIVILGAFVMLLGACGSKAKEDNSLSRVQESKELTVATSDTLFPSSYYNDDNQLVGYDVDVAQRSSQADGCFDPVQKNTT